MTHSGLELQHTDSGGPSRSEKIKIICSVSSPSLDFQLCFNEAESTMSCSELRSGLICANSTLSMPTFSINVTRLKTPCNCRGCHCLVVWVHGFLYLRSSIEGWLRQLKNPGHFKCREFCPGRLAPFVVISQANHVCSASWFLSV